MTNIILLDISAGINSEIDYIKNHSELTDKSNQLVFSVDQLSKYMNGQKIKSSLQILESFGITTAMKSHLDIIDYEFDYKGVILDQEDFLIRNVELISIEDQDNVEEIKNKSWKLLLNKSCIKISLEDLSQEIEKFIEIHQKDLSIKDCPANNCYVKVRAFFNLLEKGRVINDKCFVNEERTKLIIAEELDKTTVLNYNLFFNLLAYSPCLPYVRKFVTRDKFLHYIITKLFPEYKNKIFDLPMLIEASKPSCIRSIRIKGSNDLANIESCLKMEAAFIGQGEKLDELFSDIKNTRDNKLKTEFHEWLKLRCFQDNEKMLWRYEPINYKDLESSDIEYLESKKGSNEWLIGDHVFPRINLLLKCVLFAYSRLLRKDFFQLLKNIINARYKNCRDTLAELSAIINISSEITIKYEKRKNNSSIDWNLEVPNGPQISIEVKNRTYDLKDLYSNSRIGPGYNYDKFLKDIKHKFSDSNPDKCLQGIAIFTSIKQDRDMLMEAFNKLDSADKRVHFMIIGNIDITGKAYICTKRESDRDILCKVLNIIHSSDFAFH